MREFKDMIVYLDMVVDAEAFREKFPGGTVDWEREGVRQQLRSMEDAAVIELAYKLETKLERDGYDKGGALGLKITSLSTAADVAMLHARIIRLHGTDEAIRMSDGIHEACCFELYPEGDDGPNYSLGGPGDWNDWLRENIEEGTGAETQGDTQGVIRDLVEIMWPAEEPDRDWSADTLDEIAAVLEPLREEEDLTDDDLGSLVEIMWPAEEPDRDWSADTLDEIAAVLEPYRQRRQHTAQPVRHHSDDRPWPEHERAYWNLANRAADDVWDLWQKSGHYAAYLYFLPGGLDLRVALDGDPPKAPWQLVTGQPLPIDRTRAQITTWIRDRIGNIPLLPKDEDELDARIDELQKLSHSSSDRSRRRSA